MLIYSNWDRLDSDAQRDMVRYLKILCALKLVDGTKAALLQQVCIPALQDHDGQIVEGMDTVNKIGSYGYDTTRVDNMLSGFHQDLSVWMTVKKAAAFMRLSPSYVRHLARCGIPTLEAKKHPKGWRINPVSINDWFLRTKRVQIT